MKNSIADIKNALHREISARETFENSRRNLERENQVLLDSLDQERINRSNVDRELKRALSELEDIRARIGTLSNAVSKSESTRQVAESEQFDARRELAELNKTISKDNDVINLLESEVKKLQQRVSEVQDISVNSESEQRRSEVEIASLHESNRLLKEEIERVKTDSKLILEEKRELEDKAKSLSGLLR